MNCREIEKYIFHFVNANRKKHRNVCLVNEPGYKKLCILHSKRMAKRGAIFHGRNIDRTFRNKSRGVRRYEYDHPGNTTTSGGNISAENCAMVPRTRKMRTNKDIAYAIYRAWMTSPGHRRNIVDRKFRRIGIGVVKRGNRYYATQLFSD